VKGFLEELNYRIWMKNILLKFPYPILLNRISNMDEELNDFFTLEIPILH
jgi:hypothetical protein